MQRKPFISPQVIFNGALGTTAGMLLFALLSWPQINATNSSQDSAVDFESDITENGTGGPSEEDEAQLNELLTPRISEEFFETLGKWRTEFFAQNESKMCALSDSPFPFTSMWYLGEKIFLAMESVSVELLATSGSPQTIALGDDNGYEYLKIFMQEGANHLIGIEKLVEGGQMGQLTRESGKRSLDHPIKPNTEFKVTLITKEIYGNLVQYELSVTYISDITGKSLVNKLFIDVETPHVSPQKILTRLGIGAPAGECIYPVRLEIK